MPQKKREPMLQAKYRLPAWLADQVRGEARVHRVYPARVVELRLLHSYHESPDLPSANPAPPDRAA
jgi:hypothetical protein